MMEGGDFSVESSVLRPGQKKSASQTDFHQFVDWVADYGYLVQQADTKIGVNP